MYNWQINAFEHENNSKRREEWKQYMHYAKEAINISQKKLAKKKETCQLFMRMQIYEHIYDLSPPFFTHKWLIIYTFCYLVLAKGEGEKKATTKML